MGRLQEQLDRQDAWDLDTRLEQAMDALRCPPPDADVSVLSGGERRRVALCRLLLSQPDVLLLDEPTTTWTPRAHQWLEQHLAKYPGTVVAVTHDRYFLDNVAGWILELDRGHAYPYEGNYTTYLETKAARLTVEGQRDARLRRRLADELEWCGPAPAPGRPKAAPGWTGMSRWPPRPSPARGWTSRRSRSRPALGWAALVVEARHLAKGFGDRVLIEDLSFSLPPNGIVGVIGPNGVGKTTLLTMILGEERPDAGSIRIGETVRISYTDQMRAGIDPGKTVWEVISGGEAYIHAGRTEIPSRAYVAAFGFKGPDQQKPAGLMSGGERGRVNLALTLKQGGNLLLLDEPPTTWTSRRWPRWRTRCGTSPAAR